MSRREITWTKEELDVALRLFQAYWPTAQVPRNYGAAEDCLVELIEIAQRITPK